MWTAILFSITAALAGFECGPESELEPQEGRLKLAAVQSAYREIKTLEAEFVQHSYSAALDITEGSSGRAWFVKPGKMRWHYKLPEEQITLVEGSVVKLYQPVDQQVFIDEAGQMLISDLPIAFLMGIGDLERDFTLRKACRSGEGTLFVLDPRKEEGERERGLQGLKILADGSDIPNGVEVVDVGGNITAIRFSTLELNNDLDQELFELNIPAGTDIIDRRQISEKPEE